MKDGIMSGLLIFTIIGLALVALLLSGFWVQRERAYNGRMSNLQQRITEDMGKWRAKRRHPEQQGDGVLFYPDMIKDKKRRRAAVRFWHETGGRPDPRALRGAKGK